MLAAQDVKKAWGIFTSHDVQLAILDVMMPVMDGLPFCGKCGNTASPSSLLTARTDDVDKVLGLGLGADDYIEKPFSITELVARVGAQLRGALSILRLRENPRYALHTEICP